MDERSIMLGLDVHKETSARLGGRHPLTIPGRWRGCCASWDQRSHGGGPLAGAESAR